MLKFITIAVLIASINTQMKHAKMAKPVKMAAKQTMEQSHAAALQNIKTMVKKAKLAKENPSGQYQVLYDSTQTYQELMGLASKLSVSQDGDKKTVFLEMGYINSCVCSFKKNLLSSCNYQPDQRKIAFKLTAAATLLNDQFKEFCNLGSMYLLGYSTNFNGKPTSAMALINGKEPKKNINFIGYRQ